MRGYKKGFFIVISVLLCSVMITSTALSGTLAKYTTSSSSSDSARVAKWGVTAEIALSDEIKNSGATIVTNNENGKISHTITNLKMAPGYDYSDAFQISISGKSEVKLKVTLRTAIDYDINDFTIPKGEFGPNNPANDTQYIPIGYTYGYRTTSGVYENDWVLYPAGTGEKELISYLFMLYYSEHIYMVETGSYFDGDTELELVFEPGEEVLFHPAIYDSKNDINKPDETIDINYLEFGFNWPFDNEEYSNMDNKKDTWLILNKLNKEGVNIGYSLTVTLEQIN